MTFEKFKQIVLRLNGNRIYYDGIDKYPRNYSDFIFGDDYVNDTLMLNSYLLEQLLGPEYDCVSWFIWDWKPGYSAGFNGVEYVINNIDDYLRFKEETWGK